MQIMCMLCLKFLPTLVTADSWNGACGKSRWACFEKMFTPVSPSLIIFQSLGGGGLDAQRLKIQDQQ